MAYRRRQGITRASTFKEEIRHPPPDDTFSPSSFSSSNLATLSPSSYLAAQAIRASAAHRDSSLSSYGDSAFHSSFKSDPRSSKVPVTYEYTSLKTPNEAGGFWGVLARKAKAILDDDDDVSEQFGTPNRADPLTYNSSYSTAGQFNHPHQSPESSRKVDNPTLRKGLDALTSSLNQIGDTIGNAFEEGRSMVENKTADIIQETRKLQIRRKGTNSEERIHVSGVRNPWREPPMFSAQPQIQYNQETQLKASRDVAMATAAKAKLLLRELKTVKADLAFAKQRCSQLEGENKILREAYENGDHPADDDMIRLQLETLLAEKARLAHENSIFARENRFLMEIVEYHQLTMQDVVYLDEGIEEVTEVYPIPAVSRMLSASPPSPGSPRSAPEILPSRSPTVTKESCPAPISAQVITNVLRTSTSPSPSPSPSPIQPQSISDVPDGEIPSSSNSPVSTPKASTRQLNLSA